MNFILFLIVFGVLVLVHEFGHFICAILFGIRVEEFALGFGPSIVKKKWKNIIWKINIFPIGGYVKIYGQENREKSKDSFSERPVWQRLIVIVAGVVMNFIAASVLFLVLLTRSGFKDTFDYTILDLNKKPMFGTFEVIEKETLYYSGLVDNYPAASAGLPESGMLVKINDIELNDGNEFISYVKQHPGEEITLLVKDSNNEEKKINLTISSDGMVGIYIIPQRSIKVEYKGFAKIFSGFMQSFNYLQYQLRMLSRIISIAFASKEFSLLSDTFSGPIGVYQTIEAVSQRPNWIWDMVSLTAFISLNLAFFNILPIPAFDGGYVAMLLYELVTKKKISQEKEQIIIIVGIVLIIILSAIFFVNDIVRFKERSKMFEISNEL